MISTQKGRIIMYIKLHVTLCLTRTARTQEDKKVEQINKIRIPIKNGVCVPQK